MKRLSFKLLCTTLMLGSYSSAKGASDYREVIQSTRKILAGRCFENEDQTRMAFGSMDIVSYGHSEMDVEISVLDGETAHHREIIKTEGEQVIVEQLVNDEILGRFLVSVEPPFNVLRLRPADGTSSNFICRECMYNENERKNVCYIKMKSDNDVFVSVFREVPCS